MVVCGLSSFEDAVRPCLLRLSGVHKLFMAVETMRSEKYRQTQQDHEDMLMQVIQVVIRSH